MSEGCAVPATPAAMWRLDGEDDPHDRRYDCERAALTGGALTDDQVANAVFLDPSIEHLTIAKDRIRWLSRALIAASAEATLFRDQWLARHCADLAWAGANKSKTGGAS